MRLVVVPVVLDRMVGIGANRGHLLMPLSLHIRAARFFVLLLFGACSAAFDALVAVLVDFQEGLE